MNSSDTLRGLQKVLNSMDLPATPAPVDLPDTFRINFCLTVIPSFAPCRAGLLQGIEYAPSTMMLAPVT